MKRNLLVIIVMMSVFNMMSQEKKAVIKTDLGFLSDYNFYQLSYEFNIEDLRLALASDQNRASMSMVFQSKDAIIFLIWLQKAFMSDPGFWPSMQNPITTID